MRIFRTVLVVTIALGTVVAFSAGAGASVPGASTPSPKFCAQFAKVDKQLSNTKPTGTNYSASYLKTVGNALSSLAKAGSGKLKSDINKMAGYFKLIASQGGSINAAKFLQSHPSSLKDYSSAVKGFLTAGAQCSTTTTSTPTTTT